MKEPAQKKKAIKRDTKKTKKKKTYKVRNWHEYNESLKRRGSLDFWVEQGIIKSWKVTIIKDGEEVKRGKPKFYSDHAIETVLLLGKVFHQALRQAEGFTKSIMKQAGIAVQIPDYSTVSRRGNVVGVKLPLESKDLVTAILDSTGLKVYGEGEWKVRQHGVSKRRTWVKMHISVDRDGEIRVVVATDPSVDDAQAGITLLNQETEKIDKTIDDGGYDKGKFYDACERRNISDVVIPPREGAKIWKHGNGKGPPHLRDNNIRAIRKTSRKTWKETSGYHDRARVENTMFRYKTILGDTLSSRLEKTQATEVAIGCKILNMMWKNGMPDSYAVT